MKPIEARLASLEADLRAQRDHTEVSRIIASYGPLVDTADRPDRARLLALLWAEDGCYDIGGVGIYEGREAIALAFEAQHFSQVPEGVCHIMGLPWINVSGDTAEALNYSCVMRADGAGHFYPWRVSANHWLFERQAGRWLIRRRTNRLMTGDPGTLAMLRNIDAVMAPPPTG
jgi:hypothetical protein